MLTFTYFAYGSNMLTERLSARDASARVLGRATATGYSLEFIKQSVGGPLRVSDLRYRNEIIDAVIEAAVQAGIPRNDDFDGATQEGVSYYQGTIGSGQRWSAATAYLKPTRSRKNLVVATEAYATRLLIENRRAAGIEDLRNRGVSLIAKFASLCGTRGANFAI